MCYKLKIGESEEVSMAKRNAQTASCEEHIFTDQQKISRCLEKYNQSCGLSHACAFAAHALCSPLLCWGTRRWRWARKDVFFSPVTPLLQCAWRKCEPCCFYQLHCLCSSGTVLPDGSQNSPHVPIQSLTSLHITPHWLAKKRLVFFLLNLAYI